MQMKNELNNTSSNCNESINQPTPIYLKSVSLGRYLRSNYYGLPLFTTQKKASVSGWYILMNKNVSQTTPWLSKHINKIKSIDDENYYTLIKSQFTCPYWTRAPRSGNSLYLPGTDRYGQTLEDCAKAVRDWQEWGGTPAFKWFIYRKGTGWSGKHRCYAINDTNACIRKGKSKLYRDTGNNGWGSEFSFYKLDDSMV
jgi:hypothetical protein